MDEFSSSSVEPLCLQGKALPSFNVPVTLRAKDFSPFSVEPAVNRRTPSWSLFGDDDKARAFHSQKQYVWVINVEGYDTSLPEDNLKSALTNHFRSCGPIVRCDFENNAETDVVGRRASIIMVGDDADQKALELNGSEVGGGKLVVKAKPFPKFQTKKDMPFGATVSQVHK